MNCYANVTLVTRFQILNVTFHYFQKRLAELGLETGDIDMVVNTHCHYDHIESNYLFRGKPLVFHRKELKYCSDLYWPEFTEVFMGIMKVDTVSGEKKLSENLRVIETLGHTPGAFLSSPRPMSGLSPASGTPRSSGRTSWSSGCPPL